MAISNYTLTRLFNDYHSKIEGVKISKIVRLSDYDFSFLLFSKQQESLIISLEPINPYFLIASSYFKMVDDGNGFVGALRKYFDQGTITKFEKLPNDRIVIFTIRKTTPAYKVITNKLILELIPHNTNALIIDENNVIIDALKKTTLDDKRPVSKGIKYTSPISEDKQISKNDTLETIKNKIGRNLYLDIENRVNNGESFDSIIEEILTSKQYFSYKNDILSIPLKYQECKEIKLENLADVYAQKNQEKYMKKHYYDAFHVVEHKLKGLRNKLVKLGQDLKKNELRKDYIEIGNSLFVAQDQYQRGMQSITIDGKEIKLDEKLSLVQNANRYFKLYQKSKVALEQLKIQEDLTKEKIDYFEKIQNQLKYASIEDMDDIIEELQKDGYIKADKTKYKPNKKKKKEVVKVYHPHIIYSQNKTKIGFGLSSLQNEYLTFTLAQKDDYFLHIKDTHGPHVIIFDNNPDEETIKFAAEIALFFAEKEIGDVYLCDRKDVKKYPGKLGKVIMNNYQTIFINGIRESTKETLKQALKK